MYPCEGGIVYVHCREEACILGCTSPTTKRFSEAREMFILAILGVPKMALREIETKFGDYFQYKLAPKTPKKKPQEPESALEK